MRLAIVASHPIQYQAPLFRELALHAAVHVYFAHRITPQDQAVAGFAMGFEWDVDLLNGYEHSFLRNTARRPGLEHFFGCDTPSIRTEIAQFGPDAVVTMGWHLKSYLQAVWAAKRIGVPVMVRGDSQLETTRGPAKRLLKALIYPIGLRAFDAALYVGDRSRRYWESYGYPGRRLFFSPHCVDNDWFAQRASAEARASVRRTLGIDERTFLLLFAGRLTPNKRPLDVIAAAARLRSGGHSVEVLVAGSGALEQEMRRNATVLNVPIHLLGFRNQSQMPAVYAAADVLVLPSDANETWGLVANEALACRTPVVVSEACGCAPDLVGDGHAGLSYLTGNVDALAAAISAIHRTPRRVEAIADKVRQYSLAAAAQGILAAARAAATLGSRQHE